jgi:hypothetical protein
MIDSDWFYDRLHYGLYDRIYEIIYDMLLIRFLMVSESFID